MLTGRGWWLLVVTLFMATIGLLFADRIRPFIAIVGLAGLAWIAIEGLLFWLRVRRAIPRWTMTRQLEVNGRPTPIVWTGQPFEVVLTLANPSSYRFEFVEVEDRVPERALLSGGSTHFRGNVPAAGSIEIRYTLRADALGEVLFEGPRLRTADLQGFFYFRKRLREPVRVAVLPPVVPTGDSPRQVKRINAQMPPGLHRLRTSGGGSELHDLRDYRPGDPPKMIAWKTSARRDRLITKELETEVPIRITLFVDRSQGVRLGSSGRTHLNRMTALASAVARTAAEDRDPIGIVFFDEAFSETLAPARTRRHLLEAAKRLAAVNADTPIGPVGDVILLTNTAYPIAQELYPDLMSRKVNRLPWALFWRPVLDSRYGWLVLPFFLPWLLLTFGIGVLMTLAILGQGALARQFVDQVTPFKEVFGPIDKAMILVLDVMVLGELIWFGIGIRGWFGTMYVQRNRRKRLAALFATLEMNAPGTVSRLLDSDAAYVPRVQQFLAEHHVPFAIPLYDDAGRYLFAGADKLGVLREAVLATIGRARDNELYVVFADLLEIDHRLEPLLEAVRVARSRHHAVVIVVPWPEGIPWLPKRSPLERATIARAGHSGTTPERHVLLTERLHLGYDRLRIAFGRLGAGLVRAEANEAIPVILQRLDALRTGGIRR